MKLSFRLLILLLFFVVPVLPQTDRDKGIQFYKDGNYQSSVTFLKSFTKSNKKDSEAWNYLGLAYLNLSNFKESRKAIENAVKLNPQNADFGVNLAYTNLMANKLTDAEKAIQKAIAVGSKNASALYIRGVIFLRKGNYDKALLDADSALNIDRKLEVAYILKSNVYLNQFGNEVTKGSRFSNSLGFLRGSIDALEACIKNCSEPLVLSLNRKKLEELNVFYEYFEKRKDESFSSLIPNQKGSKTVVPTSPPPPIEPGVTPLTITTKPRAKYTDSARSAGVQGTIVLAVLFSADGITKMILPVKSLSNGLTEEALRAARQITFTPQLMDGKPVSVVKIVQYNFTLY